MEQGFIFLALNILKTMKRLFYLAAMAAILIPFTGCDNAAQKEKSKDEQENREASKSDSSFQWVTDRFADVKIMRYQVPGFDKLNLDQKKLVYYLNQAGLSGRDIMYDQNYRHNLEIRKSLENIVKNYEGDKTGEDWQNFMTYAKRVWFANGIHHHYSMSKFNPDFDRAYFESLLKETGQNMSDEALTAMFDPAVDNKKVNLDESKGLVQGSAVNFYGPDVTDDEVQAYYKDKLKDAGKRPVEYGLNTRVVKENGEVTEKVWKIGGMYSPAIEEIVSWLDKARQVAENDNQKKALGLLIEYYKTGDLEKWDEYNIAWVDATEGDVDWINGFVEVYNDPLGYKGSYETIVQITDFESSERMQTLSENAQYFEDNAPIEDRHKKENVVGISYKVVNVAGEAGDASPSTPIGVNLPNSSWIRAEHGSKSVSLGNIVEAYDNASGEGTLDEFAHDEEEIARVKEHGVLSSKLHTALHEVLGHASGKLEDDVATPKETLKNYYSTIEEGRADLVALYYIMDEKLIDLGLMDSKEVGKAEYDSYIRNGLMTQLRRLEPGADIEEAHMRNRQWVSKWVYEKGMADSVIVKVERDGKFYFDIRDYDKLRELFGQLLKKVQRIKSQGDFQAAKKLVEDYGVKVDKEIHEQVLSRAEKLDIAPYGGFINPVYEVEKDSDGNITDISITYPKDFVEQMLYYGDNYSYLAGE